MLPQGPAWKTPKDESPDAIAQARTARKAREEAEAMRLLYVAMTRAQSWLIVAAAGSIGADKSEDEDASNVVWYRLIQEAMVAAGAAPQPDGGLRLAEGDWPADIGPQIETAGRWHGPCPIGCCQTPPRKTALTNR